MSDKSTESLKKAHKIVTDVIRFYCSDMNESEQALLMAHTRTHCATEIEEIAEQLTLGVPETLIRVTFMNMMALSMMGNDEE